MEGTKKELGLKWEQLVANETELLEYSSSW